MFYVHVGFFRWQEGQRQYRVKLDTLSGRQLSLLAGFLVAAIGVISVIGVMGPAHLDVRIPASGASCTC
jgi:hypothetical protein